MSQYDFNESFNIGVYDLSGTCTFQYYEADGEMMVSHLHSDRLFPLVVTPSSQVTNRTPYLLDKKQILLDDIVAHKGNTFHMDFGCVNSLNQMIVSLEHSIEILEKNTGFRVLDDEKYYTNSVPSLKNWFRLTRKQIELKCVEKSQRKADINVIPISDRTSVEAQATFLNYLGNRDDSVLLWRSVAACIGYEEAIHAAGLVDGDKIAVIDHNTTGLVVSYITLHETDGRLIPGHRIYYDSDTKKRTRHYPVEKNYSYYSNFNDAFPFTIEENKLVPASWKKSETGWRITLDRNPQIKMLITVGNMQGIDYSLGNSVPTIVDPVGDCIGYGAARFANRMKHKIVSYYDECEALNLVVFTKGEEVEYKTLIKGTDKLQGGITVTGRPVTGIKLPNGGRRVRFYLRLGDPGRDKPLKLLEQEFTVSDDFIDNSRDVNLTLIPSMIAGQGRARVHITVSDPKDNDIFKPVDLNWELMQDAFTVVQKQKVHETVHTLEASLQRSFPVRIPPVKADSQKFFLVKRAVSDYLRGTGSILSINLNRTTWPNGKAFGIERFQRVNVFGVKKSGFDFPIGMDDQELSRQFFRRLNDDALKNWEVDNAPLTRVGWTYHGEYFPKVIERVLRELENAARWGLSIPSQYMTICANLLETQEHLVRFLKAFFCRLDSKVGKHYNWLRGAYQVLMYHTAFLESDDFTIDECYTCITNLVAYYFQECHHAKVQDYTLRVLVFLLKVRRYHPDFCRADSQDDQSKQAYDALKRVVKNDSHPQLQPVQNMLGDFLDGKGSLDLPLDED